VPVLTTVWNLSVEPRRAIRIGPKLGGVIEIKPEVALSWATIADGSFQRALATKIAEAFARVIDAKSPWTFEHSNGVAEAATTIASALGFSDDEVRTLRRAALLHDVGKLGVSSLILDKPAKLTDMEFAVIRRHPLLTEQILQRVGCFRPLVAVAAAHHERLDGSGYHQGIGGSELSLAARVLCVADVFDALRASRPDTIARMWTGDQRTPPAPAHSTSPASTVSRYSAVRHSHRRRSPDVMRRWAREPAARTTPEPSRHLLRTVWRASRRVVRAADASPHPERRACTQRCRRSSRRAVRCEIAEPWSNHASIGGNRVIPNQFGPGT